MKHLLSAADLSRADALAILDDADRFSQALLGRDVKKLPTLRGRTIITMFYENSTRTRVSFEVAGKWMSADVINVSASGSSVAKGESLRDTALTLRAAGADALIIRQRLGGVEGRRVVIVGDVLHSRVARSNVSLLHTLGAEVALVAPPTLLPVGVGTWPAAVSYDLDAVLPKSDVVMMLRVQRERMSPAGERATAFFPSAREYARRYGLDVRRAGVLHDDAVVMHPGPMVRGMEIAPEVADGVRSTIQEQVANGVSVRMAVLYLLLGGAESAIGSPDVAGGNP